MLFHFSCTAENLSIDSEQLLLLGTDISDGRSEFGWCQVTTCVIHHYCDYLTSIEQRLESYSLFQLRRQVFAMFDSEVRKAQSR